MSKGIASLRGGPAVPILIGASILLTLCMGLRQSLGLFMPPAVKDLSIAVADFTLAIALQNLAWGLLQPFAGAAAERYGFRPVMLFGSVCFVLGLLVLSQASGLLEVLLGAGALIGLGLSCTAAGIGMAVADGAAQLGARHRLGRRLAWRADCGPDRPGSGGRVRLAHGGARLRAAGAGDDPSRLGRRPGR
jgi:MFS family permease